MAFKSANLKLVYEELRAQGRSMTASRVAQLFRDGQLERLYRQARVRQSRIRFADNVIKLLELRLADPAIDEVDRRNYQRLIEHQESILEELMVDVDDREVWL